MAAIRGIERRLAHQPVDTGFGAQEAVRVIAFDLQRRGLDAGHFAVRLFHDFNLEALAFAIAQVLAQQHRSPVLCPVPPAPAWISMKQLFGSIGLANMRRNSMPSTSFCSSCASCSMARMV